MDTNKFYDQCYLESNGLYFVNSESNFKKIADKTNFLDLLKNSDFYTVNLDSNLYNYAKKYYDNNFIGLGNIHSDFYIIDATYILTKYAKKFVAEMCGYFGGREAAKEFAKNFKKEIKKHDFIDCDKRHSVLYENKQFAETLFRK